MSFKPLLAVAASAAALAIPAHAQETDAGAKPPAEAQSAADAQAATATEAHAEPAAGTPTEAQAGADANAQTEAQAGTDPDPQAEAQAGATGGLVAATASDFHAGAEVHDPQGALVGTIESVDANSAVISTGSVRAQLPFASFGRSEHGLVISMSKAELEAAAAAQSPS